MVEIARQTLIDWGVKISVKRFSRLTYKFGTEGLSIRNSKILVHERGLLLTNSQLRGSRCQILTKEIDYFSKRLSKGLFDYNKISQLNLPIGSGAVESLIRQARDLRLKGNGKFWLEQNAEIILHSRCQWLSGNWRNFTDAILTNRIYPLTT